MLAGGEAEEPVGEMDPYIDTTKRLLGMLETPAFLRRALRVDDAVKSFRRRIESQRQAWLDGVRIHRRAVAYWEQYAPDRLVHRAGAYWSRLREIDLLLAPIGSRITSASPGAVDKVWRQFQESVGRFNERWLRYVNVTDVSVVNQHVAAYNRNYLIEKECAFRSPRAAAVGFRTLPAIDVDWLVREYPLLPEVGP